MSESMHHIADKLVDIRGQADDLLHYIAGLETKVPVPPPAPPVPVDEEWIEVGGIKLRVIKWLNPMRTALITDISPVLTHGVAGQNHQIDHFPEILSQKQEVSGFMYEPVWRKAQDCPAADVYEYTTTVDFPGYFPACVWNVYFDGVNWMLAFCAGRRKSSYNWLQTPPILHHRDPKYKKYGHLYLLPMCPEAGIVTHGEVFQTQAEAVSQKMPLAAFQAGHENNSPRISQAIMMLPESY